MRCFGSGVSNDRTGETVRGDNVYALAEDTSRELVTMMSIDAQLLAMKSSLWLLLKMQSNGSLG